MFYTIYKITNTINGKFYIGKHQTEDLNDGYMGSGKLIVRAIEKYGIENFTKEILHVFESEAEMNDKEKELVVISEETYNLCPGGKGGFGYINIHRLGNPEKGREKTNSILSEKYGVTNPGQISYVRKKSSDRFKKLHQEHKLLIPKWKGRKHSDESKKKIGIANKGRVPWNKGIPRTEETKQKISQSLKKV